MGRIRDGRGGEGRAILSKTAGTFFREVQGVAEGTPVSTGIDRTAGGEGFRKNIACPFDALEGLRILQENIEAARESMRVRRTRSGMGCSIR